MIRLFHMTILIAAVLATAAEPSFAQDNRREQMRKAAEARRELSQARQEARGFEAALEGLVKAVAAAEKKNKPLETADLVKIVTGALKNDRDKSEIAGPVRTSVGHALIEAGRYREAGPILRKGLSQLRDYLPEEHPRVTEAVTDVARATSRSGDPQAAVELYRARLDALPEDDERNRRDASDALGEWLQACARYQDALPYVQDTYTRRRERLRRGVGRFDGNHGQFLTRAGEYEAAIPLLEAAIKELHENGGYDSLQEIDLLCSLSHCYRFAGRQDEALLLHERIINVRNMLHASEQPSISITSINYFTDTGEAYLARLGSNRLWYRRDTYAPDWEDLPLLQSRIRWAESVGHTADLIELREMPRRLERRRRGQGRFVCLQ